jgi:hypothetical protein
MKDVLENLLDDFKEDLKDVLDKNGPYSTDKVLDLAGDYFVNRAVKLFHDRRNECEKDGFGVFRARNELEVLDVLASVTRGKINMEHLLPYLVTGICHKEPGIVESVVRLSTNGTMTPSTLGDIAIQLVKSGNSDVFERMFKGYGKIEYDEAKVKELYKELLPTCLSESDLTGLSLLVADSGVAMDTRLVRNQYLRLLESKDISTIKSLHEISDVLPIRNPSVLELLHDEAYWGRLYISAKPEKFVENVKILDKYFAVLSDETTSHQIQAYLLDIQQPILYRELLPSIPEKQRFTTDQIHEFVPDYQA